MQTVTRAVLAAGLFACVVVSAVQASSDKPKGGPGCQVINGACVSVNCPECGPAFPATCTCLH